MKKSLLSVFALFVITTSLCRAQNPILWGVTTGGNDYAGALFNYNVSTGVENIYYNGIGETDEYPRGSLIQATDGNLYGMTSALGGGTIFRHNILTGESNNLHYFGYGTDGELPYGSLMQASDSLLYGTTDEGGTNDSGTIFSYDISTGTETDLYNFGRDSGGYGINCTLIQASDKLLYGMTVQGGINGIGIDSVYSCGTIFSYNISTGLKLTYDFRSGSDGWSPEGSFIQVNDSLLYGMTERGGTNNWGTIFSYNIITNSEKVVYSFQGNPIDGELPYGSLIKINDSMLYGMTPFGGTGNGGIIFSYNISTGTETDLYNFGNGENPEGSLMMASNGLLYGMTMGGGTNGEGFIFSYNISTGKDTVIHDFTAFDGGFPDGSLIEVDTPVAPAGINLLSINNNNLSIYPNPSSGQFNIKLTDYPFIGK